MLRDAVAQLGPYQPGLQVADPIFSNQPRPPAPPIPEHLPPQMKLALEQLQAALDGPPSLGDQWPFTNPPAVQAQIEKERKRVGRPMSVQPHQVVRLMRFLRLGHSMTEAASMAKLSKTIAKEIRAGVHPVCKHEAVRAAGVEFHDPATSPQGRKYRRKFEKGQGGAQTPSEVPTYQPELSAAPKASDSAAPDDQLFGGGAKSGSDPAGATS